MTREPESASPIPGRLIQRSPLPKAGQRVILNCGGWRERTVTPRKSPWLSLQSAKH